MRWNSTKEFLGLGLSSRRRKWLPCQQGQEIFGIDQLYRFDTAILQDDHPFLKIMHESKVAGLQEIPFLNDVAVDRRDDYFEEEHGEERNDHEGNV